MRNLFFVFAIIVGISGFVLESYAGSADSVGSNEEIRAAIEATLKIRHPTETKDWWHSLGSNTPSVIISIFKEDKNTYHQIRLIDALAWFDTPAAVEFLKEQAAHHDKNIVRRAAIRSVGLSQGIKEQSFLKLGLESSDPHTRLVTARIFSNLKDPASKQIVKEFLKKEKTEWISTSVRHRTVRRGDQLIIEGKTRN